MKKNSRVAMVGGGPSALYFLQNLLQKREQIGDFIEEITVFDREHEMGVGTPYSRKNADQYNICNISSDEIPQLDVSFVDWLQAIDVATRHAIGIDGPVSAKATYPRIALGSYFNAQWKTVCEKLRVAGIEVIENKSHEILDISDDPRASAVWVRSSQFGWLLFDAAVVATGHRWRQNDKPDDGYFASPWPIHKLLPKDGGYVPYSVGVLGASLSAFDVVTSLAHRHGCFEIGGAELRFVPDPNCGDFRLVMHSTNGWLPQLQYEQREPFRNIYRHVSRDELMSMIDKQGFLRLQVYFDKVCRPALLQAFDRDKRFDLVDKLSQPAFDLKALIEQMSSEHDYRDPFAGMRKEMPQAENSKNIDRPVHWKEIIDDLLHTLNFHAQRMPAEDHLMLHSVVMPFLMNVIAALPLESACMLLALNDAGRVEIIEGRVEVLESKSGQTTVCIERDGKKTIQHYRMFIDCSGQKPVEVGDYPFKSLVKNGAVRAARVKFADSASVQGLESTKRDRLFKSENGDLLQVGGIEIDSTYHIVGVDDKPNPRIYEIAFPHTAGLRPYSYGLQACAETTRIVVDGWCSEIANLKTNESDM